MGGFIYNLIYKIDIIVIVINLMLDPFQPKPLKVQNVLFNPWVNLIQNCLTKIIKVNLKELMDIKKIKAAIYLKKPISSFA